VNLVFGSGDFRNLTSPAGQNFVYRVKDSGSRRNGAPSAGSTMTDICTQNGPDRSGIFALGVGERLLTSPVIEGGVVAWTTYLAQTTGCMAGMTRLYAMDFETCRDAVGNNARPAGQTVGLGLPSEPVLLRRTESFLVQTSAAPTGAQTQQVGVRTRGNGRPWTRMLYWRPQLDIR
jgi:hypothetical protein